MRTLGFRDDGASAAKLTGSKGSSLAELSRLPHVNVPEGFIVPVLFYQEFLDRNRTLGDCIKKLDRLSLEWITVSLTMGLHQMDNFREIRGNLEYRIEQQAEELQRAFVAAEIPDAARTAILERYHSLSIDGTPVRVAVRSSATSEDLPTASFAGQHETYLNQQGDVQVLESVQGVWASLFSERAVAYRNDLQLRNVQAVVGSGAPVTLVNARRLVQRMAESPHASVEMAVVVQRFIDAQASGVAFNVDPRTGALRLYIEAVFGMGAALVQGTSTPDWWLVDSETFAVIERGLGSKECKNLPLPQGGMVQVETRVAERRQFCLREEQVVELAKGVANVGRYYRECHGYPYINVEFVVDRTGRINVVQARPETVASQQSENVVTGIPIETAQSHTPFFAGGNAAYAGTAIGRIRVIETLEQAKARVEDGDILVTAATQPEWNPILARVAGVITEIGGTTSHTAIVAREWKLPSMVGANGAVSALKPHDGKRVTLDAINCVLYHGELPLKAGTLEEFLWNDARIAASKVHGVTHVTHRQDEAGEWVGKPEYPLGRLQRELYLRAWDRAEGLVGLRFTKKVVDDVVYVKKGDLERFDSELKKRSIEELERIFRDRIEALRAFREFVPRFEVSSKDIRQFVNVYTWLIAHFHLRWAFGARVMEPLLREQLEKLPPALQLEVMNRMSGEMTEVQRMNIAYGELLAVTRGLSGLFDQEPQEILQALRNDRPGFLEQIAQFARQYKLINDDWRQEPPVLGVIKQLKADRVMGNYSRSTGSSQGLPVAILEDIVREFPAVREHLRDLDTFQRIFRLAYQQGIQKENEHHLQVRTQWILRDKLLAFGQRLVKAGELGKPEELFELPIDQFIRLVDTIESYRPRERFFLAPKGSREEVRPHGQLYKGS